MSNPDIQDKYKVDALAIIVSGETLHRIYYGDGSSMSHEDRNEMIAAIDAAIDAAAGKTEVQEGQHGVKVLNLTPAVAKDWRRELWAGNAQIDNELAEAIDRAFRSSLEVYDWAKRYTAQG